MEEKEEDFSSSATATTSIRMDQEAKLKDLLLSITSKMDSTESCNSSKQFIKLLRSENGPEILSLYIQTSENCIELLQAWDTHQFRPPFPYILKLISAFLSHPHGHPNNSNNSNSIKGFAGFVNISRALDKFARTIVENKMGSLYKELNSREHKRQNAALLVLGSVIRRGVGLAWEVAKTFDFKLSGFLKLAEWKIKGRGIGKTGKKRRTREAFVGFAMAFLEAGNPRLIRVVLQQREMYSGVLRGLGNDDEETLIYVLSVLRDRVLTPQSLVPPGLRSVLFGSATLEQLINVTGSEDGGAAAELAHNVLVMVCTDPANGLMPDLGRRPSPLRGNRKRLLDLMKKLKAGEIKYHRDLLLAIVKGRPNLGSTYLDEFPYNLEDLTSPNWYCAVSLAADVVSSVSDGLVYGFLKSGSDEPAALNTPDVQNVVKCVAPRPCNRLVINKGLLHSDPLVKHGTLRLVLEALKLLDSLISALDSISCSNPRAVYKWESLREDIQNQVRISLPDPQVLLTLLSSLHNYYKNLEGTRKRPADSDNTINDNTKCRKKLKTRIVEEGMDIVVGGISTSADIAPSQDGGEVLDQDDAHQPKHGVGIEKFIGQIWQMNGCSTSLEDVEACFYSKLLDAFRIYHRTLPSALEGSFDFLKVLPDNPLMLPTLLQQSLLSMLREHVASSRNSNSVVRMQLQMYKHLNPFLNLFLFSSIKDIKDQAYVLAQAAMSSTGAFDKNPREIRAWFLFIPGYSRDNVVVCGNQLETFQKLSSTVIAFLCDAVSTTGNNLFKYDNLLRCQINNLQGAKDVSPSFSPFIICVIEKCVRLLSSESGAFTLPEKSMISLYVCNTLKYLLETQVEAWLLSSLIDLLLSESLEGDVSEDHCEWRPLKSLLMFSRSVLHQRTSLVSSTIRNMVPSSSSFISVLDGVKQVLKKKHDGGLLGASTGLCFSMICAAPAEILQNFPSLVSISYKLAGVPLSVLVSIFFLESNLLNDVSKLWPEMFSTSLDEVMARFHSEVRLEEVADEMRSDSIESASVAFSFLLESAPFYVLFTGIQQLEDSLVLEHSKLQELVLAKLSGMTPEDLISSLCHVLFWFSQAQSCYRIEPLTWVEKLSEMCFNLAENILKHLLVRKDDAATSAHVCSPLVSHHLLEAAEIVFDHIAVKTLLDSPLPVDVDLSALVLEESSDNFLQLAKEGVHNMDGHLVNLLRKTSELLLSSCNEQISLSYNAKKQIAKGFGVLVQKLFSTLKDRFDGCMASQNLMPLVSALYTIHSLIRFISPFELLELAQWLFSRIRLEDTQPFRNCALSVVLHIVGCAFDNLAAYMSYHSSKLLLVDLFWVQGEKCFDLSGFESVFSQVLHIATGFEQDVAYLCLVKAVQIVKTHEFPEKQCLPFVIALSRVIASIPVNIVSCCMQRITKTKAELLFLLIETNPLYQSIFGKLLSDMIDRSSSCKANAKQAADNFVIILPAVLSYLSSATLKFGGLLSRSFENIPLFYGRRLLNSFSNWNSFVSQDVFVTEFGVYLPCSLEELLAACSSSLLGKAVIMVQKYLLLSRKKQSKRLTLFNMVCKQSDTRDHLLDCDLDQVVFSQNHSLNFINRTVAKVHFCKMLLFPEHNEIHSKHGDGCEKDVSTEVSSDIEDLSRTRMLNMLVATWQIIIQKFPLNVDDARHMDSVICSLFRLLESFIRGSIVELTMKIHDCLLNSQSFTIGEKLLKSSLIHRFKDAATLKMLQTVLTSLSNLGFSCNSVLQLLLAHSDFAPTIHSAYKFRGCGQFGMVFNPMPSILRLLATPQVYSDQDDSDINKALQISQLISEPLELFKLLNILFRISAQHSGPEFVKDAGINLRQLVFLLISSYGATLGEIDLEIYNFISGIDAMGESGNEIITNMDYLWGSAALKTRKEQEQESLFSSNSLKDTETVEEGRKIRFRENFPVDPRLCAATVLHFPYSRTLNGGIPSKPKKAASSWITEADSATAKKVQIYDPAFILRVSVHCLSMGYIEPIEFASSGLLAVTFVSLSSPDEGMRKLGYDALGRFKNSIEECHKRKDIMRLWLLLSYLQNGIEEPWQKIPSVIAIFVAEASFILLDSSHDHYSSISKLLMTSPGANMKTIPLFQSYLWSSSSNFRTERLWILRLLYAGLNMDDDAQIYIRNSVIEVLMSFYDSPLSDVESKELIVQIVKKAIKLHKLARYIVEHCALISWLSTVVSFHCLAQHQSWGSHPLTHFTTVLEVVMDVISSRNTVEWLQKYALEQLSELSSHLYSLLVGRTELIKGKATIVNLVLQILSSVLKISQKRKLYQPHFTLSVEGLYRLCEAVDMLSLGRYSASTKFGLEVVLMSNPPVTISNLGEEKLLKLITWTISTAQQSESTEGFLANSSGCHVTILSQDEHTEDSIISKLLRWLTASVILETVSRNFSVLDRSFSILESDPRCGRLNPHTLQSLLESNNGVSQEDHTKSGCEKILAESILYLQQLLGVNYRLLPSVVSALCLLYLCNTPRAESDALLYNGICLKSLCSKIRCPAEANPAWRWSYHQPWRDLSYERTEAELIDEVHAGQTLLLVISDMLRRNSVDSQILPHIDPQTFNVFEWERSFIHSQ